MVEGRAGCHASVRSVLETAKRGLRAGRPLFGEGENPRDRRRYSPPTSAFDKPGGAIERKGQSDPRQLAFYSPTFLLSHPTVIAPPPPTNTIADAQ